MKSGENDNVKNNGRPLNDDVKSILRNSTKIDGDKSKSAVSTTECAHAVGTKLWNDESEVDPRARNTDHNDGTNKRVVKFARVWNVTIPPPANTIKGRLVPKTEYFRNKRVRRITLEVHTPKADYDEFINSKNSRVSFNLDESLLPVPENQVSRQGTNSSTSAAQVKALKKLGDMDQIIVRILVPASSKGGRALLGAAADVTTSSAKKAGKRVLEFRHNKHSKDADLASNNANEENDSTLNLEDDDSFDDENSVNTSISTFGATTDGTPTKSAVQIPHGTAVQEGEWVAKYIFQFSCVTLNKRFKNVVVMTTSNNNKADLSHGTASTATARSSYKSKTREVIFPTEEIAIDFWDLMLRQRRLDQERTKRLLKAAIGDARVKPAERLSILVEIVSASDLPTANSRRLQHVNSNPYCVVSMANQQLHSTKKISGTHDPIWTIRHDSLFLLKTTTKELFRSFEGVLFEIRNNSSLSLSDAVICVARVPPKLIYEGKGERHEFPLIPHSSYELSSEKHASKLALRFRHATKSDIEFMEQLSLVSFEKRVNTFQTLKPAVAALGRTKPPTSKHISHMFSRNTKKDQNGTEIYKVRPEPDPLNPTNEWMHGREVEAAAYEKSRKWTNVGSGTLGKIFVEVLGCDHLPNLDFIVAGFQNKSDPFVTAVFEDCVVKTDVIQDSLAPRWLPWSKRAFIFHVRNPSSPIYVGVFDKDDFDDDPMGRVTVDVKNLVPNMECIRHYKLYKSSMVTDRQEVLGQKDVAATITLRIRVEWKSERKMILSSIIEPKKEASYYVNCEKQRDFKQMSFTVHGQNNPNKFDMMLLMSFLDELKSYQLVLFYLEDAFETALFWRNSVTVDLWGSTSIGLPLHSVVLFVLGTTMVEYPQLIPSFSMLGIAWIMLATMQYRSNVPCYWKRCRTFQELLVALIFDRSISGPPSVKPNQDQEQYEEWLRRWQERIDKAAKHAEKAQIQYEKFTKELENAEGGGLDISTPQHQSVLSMLNLFKKMLHPLQLSLVTWFGYLRIARNILIWEETYYAFWVTLISLVSAVVFLFVPWAFFIKWIMRILVWLLFGPWMKLVDTFYYTPLKNLSDDEREEKERKVKRSQTEVFIRNARISNENALKLKDMRVYKFGKYITRVPVLKVDRHLDDPLLSSTGGAYEHERLTMAMLAMQEARRETCLQPGQHLYGDMIPISTAQRSDEKNEITWASTGKITSDPAMLKRDENGVAVDFVELSDSAAIFKVLFVVFAAALVNWFGFPIIVSTVRYYVYL